MFTPYWVKTSANELIDSLIRNSERSVKEDIVDMLNNTPAFAAFHENVSLQNLHSSRENILSFLVQAGYLKARFHKVQNNKEIYAFSIPNTEIILLLRDTIKRWYDVTIGQSDHKEMIKALISGDISLFEHIMDCFTDSYISYYEIEKDNIEEVYHAFVLGTLITLKDSYHIESERESGYGRVDILMTPNDKNQPCIIIEMKKIRPRRETTETALEAALQQIEDRQYEAALRRQGCTNIMKVAVTFDGKRVWAKTAE